jgi:hypothetical protein
LTYPLDRRVSGHGDLEGGKIWPIEPQVWVVALGGNHVWGHVRSDGSFEVPIHLPGEEGDLIPIDAVIQNPGPYYVKSMTYGPMDLLQYPLKLEPDVVSSIHLTLGMISTLPTITGSMAMENSLPALPPSGLTVTADRIMRTSNQIVRHIITQADFRPDSTFTIPLAAGDNYISVHGIPTGFVVRTMSSGAIDLLKDPIRIDGTGRASLFPIRITLGLR